MPNFLVKITGRDSAGNPQGFLICGQVVGSNALPRGDYALVSGTPLTPYMKVQVDPDGTLEVVDDPAAVPPPAPDLGALIDQATSLDGLKAALKKGLNL